MACLKKIGRYDSLGFAAIGESKWEGAAEGIFGY